MENVRALISRTKGKYKPCSSFYTEEWIDGTLNILQGLFVYLTEDQGKPFHFYTASRNELVLNLIFPNVSIDIHGMEQPVKAWRIRISEMSVRVCSWERAHANPAEILHTASTGHLVAAV